MKRSMKADLYRVANSKALKKTLVVASATCGLLFVSAFFASAQAPAPAGNLPNPGPSSPGAIQPDTQRMAAVILIKNALLAVNQGNLTGNYTVLRDLSSPAFREKNSAADLAAIFQGVRQQKFDLSPIVVMEPALSEPRLTAEGQLALDGFFAFPQMRVNFQLLFVKAGNGGWLIHGVSLNAAPETAAISAPLQR